MEAHGSLVLPPPWSDDGGGESLLLITSQQRISPHHYHLPQQAQSNTALGQIGMRPPLHCASTFSTCLWFTNFTRIPGVNDFTTATRDNRLFSQMSFLRRPNSWPGVLDLQQAVLLRSRWFFDQRSSRWLFHQFLSKPTGLPKLHEKRGCEETGAPENYLDWQVHLSFLAAVLIDQW